MPCIFFRPLAETDLSDIWDYISADSPERGEKLIRDIYSKLGTIAHNPYIGKARPEIEQDLRSFPVGRYIVFYFPLPEGIDVIRILHGSRDIDKMDPT
jgi:toxin ParE1/3/4